MKIASEKSQLKNCTNFIGLLEYSTVYKEVINC